MNEQYRKIFYEDFPYPYNTSQCLGCFAIETLYESMIDNCCNDRKYEILKEEYEHYFVKNKKKTWKAAHEFKCQQKQPNKIRKENSENNSIEDFISKKAGKIIEKIIQAIKKQIRE